MYKFLKTKKGFTLVELLVVVSIIGILVAVAVPIYNSVTKSSHIKVCRVARLEVETQAKSWCMENGFNNDYSYKIISTGEKGTIIGDGYTLSAAELANFEEIHSRIPYCPSCGTYTVRVIPRANGVPKIEVVCDGGDDGDVHMTEE